MLKGFFHNYRSDVIGILGLTITFAALHIALREAHPARMRITVAFQQPLHSSDLDLPPGLEERVVLSGPDGAVATNPQSTYFIVDNPGEKTIRPEDFISPLQITPAAGERILFIHQYSCMSNGPVVTWNILSNQTATMSPTLFNPGDVAPFFLVTDRSTTLHPPFGWTGRIAGIKYIEVQDLEEALISMNSGMSFLLIMNAKSIAVFFLVLSIFIAILIRGWRQRVFPTCSAIGTITVLCISAIIFAVIAAECVAYQLVYRDKQFLVSYVGLVAFALFLIMGYVRGARMQKEDFKTRNNDSHNVPSPDTDGPDAKPVD